MLTVEKMRTIEKMLIVEKMRTVDEMQIRNNLCLSICLFQSYILVLMSMY